MAHHLKAIVIFCTRKSAVWLDLCVSSNLIRWWREGGTSITVRVGEYLGILKSDPPQFSNSMNRGFQLATSNALDKVFQKCT